MTEKLYTQDEMEQLKKEWESDLFESKTNAALSEIRGRLDVSNGYKETIGKDVTDIKNDVKELRVKVLELENARLKEEKTAKEAQEAKSKQNQDRQARIIGYASLALWGLTLIKGTGALPQILHGLGF